VFFAPKPESVAIVVFVVSGSRVVLTVRVVKMNFILHLSKFLYV